MRGNGGAVGFGQRFDLEFLCLLRGQFALEDSEPVIFEFLAVGKTYDIVEGRAAYAHNFFAGKFLRNIAANGLRH
mgnify:CR=1 FL=1